jgi:hypothetical protein
MCANWVPGRKPGLRTLCLLVAHYWHQAGLLGAGAGHAKFEIENKSEAYKWRQIRKQYETEYYDQGDDDNPCFPARIDDPDYCGRTDGHEWNNPSNHYSCVAGKAVAEWGGFHLIKFR